MAGKGLHAACTLLCCAAPAAFGVEYRLDGSMALGQQYYSNLFLSQPKESAAATGVEIIGALSAGEQNWQVNGKARINNWYYLAANTIDLQNEYLDVNALVSKERSRWNLTGNFTDDTVLSSQSNEVQGLILARLRRNLKSLGSSWAYSLDENNQATLGYNYSHSEYTYADGRIIRADNHTVSSGFIHQFNERLSLSEDLSYSRYSSQSSYQYTADYVSYYQGLKYSLSPTVMLNFSGGIQYSQMQQSFQQAVSTQVNGRLVSQIPPTIRNSQLWPLFTVSASKRFENSDIVLSYNRQLSPSVNGVLIQMDNVALNNSHRLSDRLSGDLSLSYGHQQGTQAINLGVSDYSVYGIGGALAYRWTENLTLSTYYRYQLRQLNQASAQNTDNHFVLLNIKYDFDPK